MARKETIYTVNKETNTIIRVSRTFLAAIQFAATLPANTYEVVTSEFSDLKKGEQMTDVTSVLA